VAEGVQQAALTLAAAAAAVGREDWERDAGALAGAPPPERVAAPTYRDVALAGLAVVEALADEGRWADADAHAAHLLRFFSDPDAAQPAITRHGFDGLRAAARARDRDEVEDFLDLLREIFADRAA